MKKCMLFCLCLFVYQIGIAQENKKSFDYIICIDDEIATSLAQTMIIAKQGTNVVKKIDITYHPGDLSISPEDYDFISSKQGIKLFLQFDHYQYSSRGKQRFYSYEIEMGKIWFKNTFLILKIYNLDKFKYRHLLEPLSKDQNYTYELDTSEGQMFRIRKAKREKPE